jgi:predicted flavoprotein YhiN
MANRLFNQKQTYRPNIQAYINALANGHFNRRHNTVWTAFNKATDAIVLSGKPITGTDLKAYFKAVAASYPGTGARGATDAGAANAGRHISAIVKFSVFEPI